MINDSRWNRTIYPEITLKKDCKYLDANYSLDSQTVKIEAEIGKTMRYLIYLTLLASTSLTAGSIHKWTDADGNVFYGDAPPMSTKTENVWVQSAPSNPGKALPRLSSPDSEAAPAAGNAVPEDQAKVGCDNAQNDLEIIQSSSRVKLKLADGSTRYLTTEEIDERRAQAESEIERFCQ